MVEGLMTSVWALEPRFHDVNAALAVRRMSSGKPAFEISAAEKEKQQPYVLDMRAGFEDASGEYHFGWNATGGDSGAGRVAVIPIVGAMTRYGGLCSYGSEDIAGWVTEANRLDEISGIVLEIDSPGGEVNGTELLGEAVRQSKKPVVAYVKGMAASAAYWVASQAKEIMLESEVSSSVGSIGVLAMHVDASKFYEKEGYQVTILRSDGSEDKALFNSVEPLSAEVMTEVKGELNAAREHFVKTVKKGRSGIAGDVFSGKMYSGKDAIAKGMADSVGFFGDAIKRVMELAK